MKHSRPKQRPRFALPFGINLSDYDFQPTRQEKLLDRVHEMKLLWDREDDERRRLRSCEIAKEIEQEKRKQAVEDRDAEEARQHQEEIDRRKTYWLRERETGAAAMEKLVASYEAELNAEHAKRLKKLAQITKDIRKDKARVERRSLLEKGVLRGRYR
jgi:hypothetical protein